MAPAGIQVTGTMMGGGIDLLEVVIGTTLTGAPNKFAASVPPWNIVVMVSLAALRRFAVLATALRHS